MTETDAGKRVRIKENKSEGWQEQTGIFHGVSSKCTAIVRVDDKFLAYKGDDGFREVPLEFLEYVTTWEIFLTRTTTMKDSCSVEIEAVSKEDAETRAIEKVEDVPDWSDIGGDYWESNGLVEIDSVNEI